MQAEITINLKEGVLDPQAKAIHHAIESLGFSQVANVVVKKQIILEFASAKSLDSTDSTTKEIAQEIAHSLLANPVIEDYEVRIKEK